MIIRVRFKNCSSNEIINNWTLYSVSGQLSLRSIFDNIFLGGISPLINLDWSYPNSCVAFVGVTSKEKPDELDLQEASDFIKVEELHETNRKIFIQYSLKALQPISQANEFDLPEPSSQNI